MRAREAAGRHFMPAALLASQLAALEAGSEADWLLVIEDDRPPEAAAAAVLDAWLGLLNCGGGSGGGSGSGSGGGGSEGGGS